MPSNSTDQEILDQKAAADAFLARAAEMRKRTSWFATNQSNNKERRSKRSSEIIRSSLTKELTEEISLSDSDDDEEEEDTTESTLLTTDETITEQGEQEDEEDLEDRVCEDEYNWELSDDSFEESLEDDCPDARNPIVRVAEEGSEEVVVVETEEEDAEKGTKGGLNRGCSHSTISETDSGWSNASDDLDDDDEDDILPVQPEENNVDPALEEPPLMDVNDSDAGKQDEEKKHQNSDMKADDKEATKKPTKSSKSKRKAKKTKKKKSISKRPSFNWEKLKSDDKDSDDVDDRLDWLPTEIELERAMMNAGWEKHEEEDMPLPSHDDLLKRIEALERELEEEKRQRENLHEELLDEQVKVVTATSDRCDALELHVQEQTRIILRQQDMIAVLAKHVEEEQKQRKAMESKMLGLIEDLRFRSEIRKEWMIKEVERNKEHIRAQQKRSNIRDGICSADSSGSLSQYLDKSIADSDLHHQDSTSTSTAESSRTICTGSTTKESSATKEPSIKLYDPSGNETEEYYLGFPDRKNSLRNTNKPSKKRRPRRGPGPMIVEDPIPRSLKEVQLPPTPETRRRKSKRLSLPFISMKTTTTTKPSSGKAAKTAKTRRASTGAPLATKRKQQPTISADTRATNNRAKTDEGTESPAPSPSRETNRVPVSNVTEESTTTGPQPESPHLQEKKKTCGQCRRVSAPPRMQVDALDRLSMKYRAAAIKMQLEPYID